MWLPQSEQLQLQVPVVLRFRQTYLDKAEYIYISPLRLEFMLSGIDYIYSVGCLIIFGAAAAVAAA